MIDISNQHDERLGFDRVTAAESPRQIGELMNAVLARYGISANSESVPPRLPVVDCQAPLFDVLVVAR